MRVFNFPVHGQVDALIQSMAEKANYRFQFTDTWRHDKEVFVLPAVEKVFDIVAYNAQQGGKREIFLLRSENILSELTFAKQYLSVNTYSENYKDHSTFLANLKKIFVEVKDDIESDQVEIKFWYNTNSGPVSVNRQITVPTWEDIGDNYSKNTREPLNALINEFKPTEKTGQLILWHGVPGTGKTYALRSLIKSWRQWCGGEYIMDPEALFGHSPGYLINMILAGSDEYYDDDEDTTITDNKWRLLILEDTGELLSESAKERAGQGLSRLLNLVDGLIGQGLKVLVLITTNEEIEKLHPAVSRDGRCLAAIKFESFNLEESIQWANTHDVEDEISKPYTLAELFAKSKTVKPIHTEIKTKKNILGFARVPH